MKTTLENVQGIVKIKKELKDILVAVGMNPTDSFETYAGLFRQALEMLNTNTEEEYEHDNE